MVGGEEEVEGQRLGSRSRRIRSHRSCAHLHVMA